MLKPEQKRTNSLQSNVVYIWGKIIAVNLLHTGSVAHTACYLAKFVIFVFFLKRIFMLT
jgi:hypothetical protein